MSEEIRKKLRNDRGASMVEFAIVLPLLLLLAFGAIEFGLLYYNKAIITNASREGARAGIVRDTENNTYPHKLAYITMVVNSYTRGPMVTFTSPNPDPTTATDPGDGCVSRGSDLTVTVTYPYTFLAFSSVAKLIPGTFPDAITLSAQTVMRCE